MIPNIFYLRIKGSTNAHLGPIWNHLEPSDVPYSQNQFLGLEFHNRTDISNYATSDLISTPCGFSIEQ